MRGTRLAVLVLAALRCSPALGQVGAGREREARDAQRRLEVISKREASEKRAWERSFRKVVATAEDPGRRHLALAGYRQALESFPVYADQLEGFRAAQTKFSNAYRKAQWVSLGGGPRPKRAYGSSREDGGEAGRYLPSGGSLLLSDGDDSQATARLRELEEGLERDLLAAREGVERFRKGDFAEAVERLTALVTARPQNAEGRHYLDQAHAGLRAAAETPTPQALSPIGEPAPPIPSRPAPSRAPPPEAEEPSRPNAQVEYLKGLKAYSLGDRDAAIAHWRACLASDPEHAKAQKALTRALWEKR